MCPIREKRVEPKPISDANTPDLLWMGVLNLDDLSRCSVLCINANAMASASSSFDTSPLRECVG